ncbi:putative bifunctional diguanylate cyclase/phosphodiesterase [Alkanindiges illinoisensis]|uniref:cyclic-guanylate-specific phosphodiesterase n=1 Tax=Alkanindiges illinoisensis TaxID=197183 RepID=A0A4Y7XDA2_9GAMM|nr:bifunctional diguanylate cyclase/phosphodiesterase [Alkanindiges illinoisensis]TEU27913.1 bifunctional diguanylate cyclase/phosphodiesterase [Alkanindiges illinoisensis]
MHIIGKRIGRHQNAYQLRLTAMKLSAINWLMEISLLSGLVLFASLPLWFWLLYTGLALICGSCFYILHKTRLSERFKDPTLALPHLLVVSACQFIGLYLVPELNFLFLIRIVEAAAYGLFLLTVRQFMILFIIFAIGIAVFIGFGTAISFPTSTLAIKVLLYFSLVLAISRFIVGSIYLDFLRSRLVATNKAIKESEARFRALTDLSSDWYWEQDAEFRITRFESGRASKDLPPEMLLGKRLFESGITIKTPGGWEAHKAQLLAHQSFRDLILHFAMPDNLDIYISVSGEAVLDSHGILQGYRGVARDISEQKRADAKIEHLATHDSLTGLPNRVMYNQMLSIAVQSALRYGGSFAVLFIDLDRFKFINDTLGHEAGDQLLYEISTRFRQTLRTSDIVARLGGDEFVVLVPQVHEKKEIALIARKIVDAAIAPFLLQGQECRVTASVGIAIFPDDGQDEVTLIKSADIAMYAAKEAGKNNYQFFSEQVRSYALERMALERNLRQALERHEFTVLYQPKRDLASGAISGVEALLRWQNPELGPISPAQFIPIAEETGMIVPIGKWVLRTACLQNMAWQREGLPPVCMAVNLSVRQFTDDHLLLDIATILKETGMDPRLLELEITEGLVMRDPAKAITLLAAIKEIGVRLAIDDFGTGYSSLAQLKNFPIDTLKVDRSFIREVATNASDKAITEAIIAMGKTLCMTVIAEGVETEEQEDFLRQNSCDQMQGYYFSKAVLPEEFASLLRTHHAIPLPEESAFLASQA